MKYFTSENTVTCCLHKCDDQLQQKIKEKKEKKLNKQLKIVAIRHELPSVTWTLDVNP